jgi:hypothetical protein
MFFYCMNCSEIVCKQKEVCKIMCLTFTHLSCIVLQQRNCHYCNLYGENLYELYILFEAEGNKGSGYKFNFFFGVRDQLEGNLFCRSKVSSVLDAV